MRGKRRARFQICSVFLTVEQKLTSRRTFERAGHTCGLNEGKEEGGISVRVQ